MTRVAREHKTNTREVKYALDENGYYVSAGSAIAGNKNYKCDSCSQWLVLVHKVQSFFFRHYPGQAVACVEGYTPNGQCVDYYGAAARAAQRDHRELVLECCDCDQDLPYPYVITDRNLNGFNRMYGDQLRQLALTSTDKYRMKVGVSCPWIETARCPSCCVRYAAEQAAVDRAYQATQQAKDAQERVAVQLIHTQKQAATQVGDVNTEAQSSLTHPDLCGPGCLQRHESRVSFECGGCKHNLFYYQCGNRRCYRFKDQK
jgi:hypothetical protein